jgi:hypothetical protein
VEYHKSKWKYVGFLIFTAGIFFWGIYSLRIENPWWWGVIAIILGAIGSFLFVKELRNNQPRIILDDEGVIDTSLNVGKILWSDLSGSNLMQVQRSKWITLEMSEEVYEKYLSQLGSFQRKMLAGNVAMGLTPLNLNVIGLKASAEDIFDKFNEYRALSGEAQ